MADQIERTRQMADRRAYMNSMRVKKQLKHKIE